jgi:MFS family permease
LRLPPALRALHHRNYRLLFFGQMISICGVWMQSTAQGWLVLRLSDSTFWLGMIAAAQSLPVLLLSLPAGTIADRVPKRRLLLTTQSIAMGSALLLAVLTFTGLVEVWHVLLLALLTGSASAFENPARQAFTIELVGREDLLPAIALDSMMFNGARIIGPAFAGIIAALVGEAPAFLFNGLSFSATIAGLLMMRLPPFTPPAEQRRAGQLREGIAYIRSDTRVRLLLLQLAVFCTFCLAYIPLLPSFARDVLGGDAATFGAIASTNAAGALVAAVMIGVLGDRMPRARMRQFALLSYPLLLGGFTLARSLPPALLMIGLVGWAGITILTISNTLLQMLAPNELRGRVMSFFVLMVMGVSQISGLAIGALAEVVGDVALTVGVWTLVGLGVQLVVTLTHTGVELEPQRAPKPAVAGP